MNEYTDQSETVRKPRDSKNLFIGLLIAGLVILAGFFIYDHSKSAENIQAQQTEVAKMKTEIRSILNKKNATASELSRARNLIAQLNGKINDLESQIAMLTQEND